MTRCPVCGSSDLGSVIQLSDVPVFCNVLYDTREEALAAPTGDIDLVACRRCDMVFNASFDVSLVVYEGSYENSLHFSPTFREYADDLAHYLADRYELNGGLVLEIGCGKGEFLEHLCEVAGSRGLGFDPSFSGEVTHPDVEIVADELPERLDSSPDLVIFRHVLEHLSQPLEFLGALERALEGRETAIYCEVPSGEFVLGNPSLWDVIYEHVGYFTETSLRNVFTRAGFRTERIVNAFGGQFLAIEARNEQAASDNGGVDGYSSLLATGNGYGEAAPRTLKEWSSHLARWSDDNVRVAIWGIGSKGVTFLNLVEGADGAIDVLVDINPRKHGKYVPRVARAIDSHRVLERKMPDTVLIMNPIYEREISDTIASISLETDQPMPQVITVI